MGTYKVTNFSRKKFIKLLLKNGFELKSTKGSHCLYRHPQGARKIPVPINVDPVSPVIVKQVMEILHLSKREICEMYNKL